LHVDSTYDEIADVINDSHFMGELRKEQQPYNDQQPSWLDCSKWLPPSNSPQANTEKEFIASSLTNANDYLFELLSSTTVRRRILVADRGLFLSPVWVQGHFFACVFHIEGIWCFDSLKKKTQGISLTSCVFLLCSFSSSFEFLYFPESDAFYVDNATPLLRFIHRILFPDAKESVRVRLGKCSEQGTNECGPCTTANLYWLALVCISFVCYFPLFLSFSFST
jgi:hypothetical protein